MSTIASVTAYPSHSTPNAHELSIQEVNDDGDKEYRYATVVGKQTARAAIVHFLDLMGAKLPVEAMSADYAMAAEDLAA